MTATKGSPMVVDDLPESEQYLSEKTKKAMETKSEGLLEYRADALGRGYVYSKCIYLGKTVPLSKLEDGIKFVAEKLNLLGDADKIKSSMTRILKVDLYNDGTQEGKCAVVAYVHVDLDTYEEVMKDIRSFGAYQEGEIPHE